MSMRPGFSMIETGICWWSKSRSHKHVLDSLFVCVSLWRNAYFIAWWYKREKGDQITCCYPLLINTATQHNDHCMIPCQNPYPMRTFQTLLKHAVTQKTLHLSTLWKVLHKFAARWLEVLQRKETTHAKWSQKKKKVNWDSLQCSTTNLVACFKLPSHRSG
jgi:hypothetical protein